tara:strand:- start:49 stop:288 length:240 start_codon:yes stop_codon:yes gene_type:complete
VKKDKDKEIKDILDSIENLEEATKSIAKFIAILTQEILSDQTEDEFVVKTKRGEIHIPIPVLLEIEKYLGHRLEFMGLT